MMWRIRMWIFPFQGCEHYSLKIYSKILPSFPLHLPVTCNTLQKLFKKEERTKYLSQGDQITADFNE